MSVADKLEERNRRIRGAFVMQGTSLHAWCIANGVKPQNATKALKGQWTGPKATDLVRRILAATGGIGRMMIRVSDLLGVPSRMIT